MENESYKTEAALKTGSIKVFSNDKLVSYSDGSYRYYDSYGDELDIVDTDALYCWLSDEEIELTEELEEWIKK